MITSIENKQLKQIMQLNTKAKARKKAGLFAVEGVKMFLEAPDKQIAEVYVSESFYNSEEGRQVLLQKKRECQVVSDKIFSQVCDTLTPQGILTLVHFPEWREEQVFDHKEKTPLILVLDTIQDPGNLGTMIRTGEGAGLTGVVMNKNTVDIFNPKTIRATMGSIYRIPFLITEDLTATIAKMKERGIHTYAAHLKGQKDFYREEFMGPTAFFIGNEGNGLSEEVAALADTYVKIPMEGQVESLNAAIAASVMMYECKRQRDVQA